MKKLDTLKTIQMFVYIILSGIVVYLVVIKGDIYHRMAEDSSLQLVCILLWASLFVSFMFIFLDFSMYSKQKNDINALDYAVHSDPLAKIANRSGCDEVIEQYIDKKLPANMAVVMIFLTSLADINKTQSRTEGNKQIRAFSIILKLASVNMCFVGRNGGNVFMAIFEDTTRENIELFLDRIENKVMDHNSDSKNLPMNYKFGLAFHEDSEKGISDLISLANTRARESSKYPQDYSIKEEGDEYIA